MGGRRYLGLSLFVFGCSQPARQEAPVDASIAPLHTEDVVSSWRARFVVRGVEDVHQIVVDAEATRFDVTESSLLPVIDGAKASLSLPRFADEPWSVATRGAHLRVRLERAAHAPARIGEGSVVYDASDGVTLAHVPTSAGTEEYLLLSQPPRQTAVRYVVELSEGAGLRLVGDVLEVLADDGDPRLRTSAPWIVDDKGVGRRGTIAVEGCRYDTSAAAPRGRPLTDPGSRTCVVVTRFDDRGLTYPVLVDPAWSETSTRLGQPRAFHRATAVTKASTACAGGCVLVTGGNANDTVLSSAELYDVTAGTWSSAGTIPGGARWLHVSEPTGDGRVLVAGGVVGIKDFDDAGTSTAAVYDPASGWTARASMSVPRGTAASGSVPGKIFVTGGGNKLGTAGAFQALSSGEVYTVSTNAWAPIAAMNAPRRLHAMAVWSCGSLCGSLLVAGGFSAGTTAAVEQSTNGGAWADRGNLTGPRYGLAVVDVGAKVLFAGGLPTIGTPSPKIDVFDKATLALTPFAADLGVGRGLLAGAPFNVGTVTRALFVGGTSAVGGSSDQGVNAADTLDVALNDTFPHAMKYRRAGLTATAISGNRVLVAGGRFGTAPFSFPAKEELFAAAPNKSSCSAATVGECQSLLCVDGVCCNTLCTGQCEACNVAGKEGTCSAVPAGGQAVLPRTPCSPYGGSCGYACNGVDPTKCNAPTTSKECQAAKCVYDTTIKAYVETSAAYCSGTGTCSTTGSTTTSCGAYTCNGTACRKTCTVSTDCASGYTCKSGVCVTTGGLGSVCTANDQCTSKFCVDGTCCATSACASGLKCNVNGKGTCSKPNGVACGAGTECGSGYCINGVCCNTGCAGVCEACNVGGSVGSCSPVRGAPKSPKVCPGTGVCAPQCDGADRVACKAYPAGETTCVSASCLSGTATAASTCNGKGSCNTTITKACEPYACGTLACKTSCTSNADCKTGYVCKTGVCATSGALGTACADDAECTSKHCAGGATPDRNVCCSVATCPAGTYCAGTEAGAAAGTCLKQRGESCTAAKDCGSGFCFDGLCCDRACSGQCEACDVPGAEGTCSAVSGDPHGTRAKCDDGGPNLCRATTCDGDRSRTQCLAYKNGPSKECAPASCTDGVEKAASYCNGEGTCLEPEPEACGAYQCGATACKTTCAVDADCATGYACKSGKCQPADAPRAKCTDDLAGSIPPEGGTPRGCAPYQCNPSSGDCFTECATTAQCASGSVCDGAKCVPAPASDGGDGGSCGCSTPGTHASSAGSLALLALVALAALRRTR